MYTIDADTEAFLATVAPKGGALSNAETAEILGGTIEKPTGGFKIVDDILGQKGGA